MDLSKLQHLAGEGWYLIPNDEPARSGDQWGVLKGDQTIQDNVWNETGLTDVGKPRDTWAKWRTYLIRRKVDMVAKRLAALEESVKRIEDILAPKDQCAQPIAVNGCNAAKECDAGPKEYSLHRNDFMVCKSTLATYQIFGIDQFGYTLKTYSEPQNVMSLSVDSFHNNYREAGRDEIRNYLLLEAVYLGFKPGAMISLHEDGKNPMPFYSLHVWFPGDTTEHHSPDVSRETRKGKPFAWVRYGGSGGFNSPVKTARLIKDDEISVTVDSVKYVASFCVGHVEFGCAKITNGCFKDAKAFLSSYDTSFASDGFKAPTAVQIGKGLFSRELLDRIVKRLK